MRIGMILDKSFPPDPRVENEAFTLIQNGHEVFLYCFDYNDGQKTVESYKGIQINRIKINRFIYKTSAFAYTIPIYHLYLKGSISKFIKNNNIEVLHIHDMQIARSVFLVNEKLNLPVVLDLHENRPEIMKYYAHVNSLLGKLLVNIPIWKKFEFKYIEKAQRVIVITEQAKQYYLQRINVDENKFCVVPNSVLRQFYMDYQSNQEIIDSYEKKFTVLYLGDTGSRRGIETMIKSLKYLINEIPNIKLVIVGRSKSDYILKRLVIDSKFEKYVDLLGWKDFDLFPSYILASDIGVCPIHKNIHHETTYANKIFQCLSFGRPMVVSDCEAQQRVIEKYDCGLVFKDRDEKDFANKILKLYKETDLYNRMSENAKNAIEENLNWEVTSKDLITMYRNIWKK